MLIDLLEKQNPDSERQQYTVSLWKPRYFIQLQISNNQAQTLTSQCGVGELALKISRKSRDSLKVEAVLQINFAR